MNFCILKWKKIEFWLLQRPEELPLHFLKNSILARKYLIFKERAHTDYLGFLLASFKTLHFGLAWTEKQLVFSLTNEWKGCKNQCASFHKGISNNGWLTKATRNVRLNFMKFFLKRFLKKQGYIFFLKMSAFLKNDFYTP